MKTVFVSLFTLALGFILVLGTEGGEKNAETKVKLKRVHMCCDGCATEVATILQKMPGIKEVSCDHEANTAQFTASNATAAQKALDALATKGFHGDSLGPLSVLSTEGTGRVGRCTESFLKDAAIIEYKASKSTPGMTIDSISARVRCRGKMIRETPRSR